MVKLRKLTIMVIFGCIASFNLFAQSASPIIGYDKVQWGTSVQTVTQTYSGIREDTSQDTSIGVREFSQKNVGNGIEERSFYFFNNKLYRVAVRYEKQRDVMTALYALAERLVEIYGKFDDTSSYSKPFDNTTCKFIDIIRHYNNDLTIFLRGVDVYNRFNNPIANYILCIYSNPATENEVEAARRKHTANNFGL
jgi:hypothetical protein